MPLTVGRGHLSTPDDEVLAAERVAQPVADEVERQHRYGDRNPRREQAPRVAQDVRERRLEHRPPAGVRRLDTEAEEAEPCFCEQRVAEADRNLHDQRRGDVREARGWRIMRNWLTPTERDASM